MAATHLPVSPPVAEPEQPPPVVMVGRRAVLRTALVGGTTVVVAGTGVLSYRVFDTRVLDPGGGRPFDAWSHWRDTPGPLGTVAAAILAANPHNSQAWAFHVTETAVDVYADPARGTGTLDTLGRELQIGLGCALENLVLAARVRGLDPTVSVLPQRPGSDLVAHVAFVEAAAERPNLYDAIGDRHTNRGPYTSEDVPAGVLADLVDLAELPGLGVHWVTEDGDKAALGQLLVDAATAVTQDEQQSRDSFAWLRSNDDEIQRHRDGLTLDAQGLSPVTLTLAKLLPASSRAYGDSFWVKQTRDVHTKTAAAYGVITVTDPDDFDTQLLGGRLLQRIHLTATRQGLALHHMNQITERIDRERATGQPETFAARFAELLPAAVQPLSTFRVGHAVRDAKRSPRRLVSEVTR